MLTDELGFTCAVARAAGEVIAASWSTPGSITRKSSHTDIATEVDVAAERVIVDAIAARFPEDGIFAEESNARIGTNNRRWIIDPLDGTANFVRGLWPSVVSIALEIQGVLSLGVVFDPRLDDMFAATAGQGATCNNSELAQVADDIDLKHAFVGLSGSNRPDCVIERADIFRRLSATTDSVRDVGSTAMHLCLVASGALNAHIALDVQLWDVAAGFVIAREAGCLVEGNEPGSEPTSAKALVANPKLMAALRAALS